MHRRGEAEERRPGLARPDFDAFGARDRQIVRAVLVEVTRAAEGKAVVPVVRLRLELLDLLPRRSRAVVLEHEGRAKAVRAPRADQDLFLAVAVISVASKPVPKHVRLPR